MAPEVAGWVGVSEAVSAGCVANGCLLDYPAGVPARSDQARVARTTGRPASRRPIAAADAIASRPAAPGRYKPWRVRVPRAGRAAHQRLTRALEERRAAEVLVTTGLNKAYQSLAAHAEVTTLRQEVLPRRPERVRGRESRLSLG
jgi:hypothetical protein